MVTAQEGFEYKAQRPEAKYRSEQKWGWVSDTPGVCSQQGRCGRAVQPGTASGRALHPLPCCPAPLLRALNLTYILWLCRVLGGDGI